MNATREWRLPDSLARCWPRILALSCGAVLLTGAATPPAVALEPQRLPAVKLRRYHPPTPSAETRQQWLQRSVAVQSLRGVAQAAVSDPLQIDHWFFSVTSSRDGNQYQGVIVGSPALAGGGVLTTTPVQIIPVIVNTASVGLGVIGFSTVLTTPGVRTFDPAVADPACLTSSPTKVPLKIFKKSPLFKNAPFNFGGVDVGFTQFGDAIQRAQFWNTIDPETYHVRLGPLSQPAPLTLNVPAPGNGTGGLSLDPAAFGLCGPMAIVDINLIDNFVISQFAALAAEGVSPSTFPIFVFYNTGFAGRSDGPLQLLRRRLPQRRGRGGPEPRPDLRGRRFRYDRYLRPRLPRYRHRIARGPGMDERPAGDESDACLGQRWTGPERVSEQSGSR
jgi:hypothetical protein